MIKIIIIQECFKKNCHRMYTSRSNILSFQVTSIRPMSKDIVMGVRKGTVVSFVPTLFGCFLEISSLYVFQFVKMFSFVTLSYINRTNLGAIASQSYLLKYVVHLCTQTSDYSCNTYRRQHSCLWPEVPMFVRL